ncbi:Rpn family recombination-promoting nuclease/putative transposase [Pantanalinema sp. GBBB05]|uniref:Rpn family recombination-promoting nuclease/putative transposase n=1 Tax=Pantanalinema sp. GBBB05 TaxID=2604139 RepID=UPI001DD57D1D|nr:Rpn family recombination-promoting nuclease/putative transposase [Pantanalinema sp. GBBB05]
MFDNICKFLAETFSTDFATWLLGESIELTELSPSELSLEPIRADALILRQSEDVVLHCEFQTEPKADIPFRMADYRLRVYRRFPNKRMQQMVIYLQQTRSERVQQTAFTLERTHHEFDVIRLWEQPTEVFLRSPGLLPFVVLSQTSDRTQVLRQVAQAIDQLPDRQAQSNITASAYVLAGLVLEKEVVGQVLRRDMMQESVTYQEIRQEGEQSKAQQIALNMIREGMALEAIARVTGLSIEQVEQLQELGE